MLRRSLASLLLLALGAIALPVSASGAPPSARTGAAFFGYTRPQTYESVETTVQVPVRDGTRLGCDLYRPGRDGTPVPGRFPGIVHEYTPYHGAVNVAFGAQPPLGAHGARIFSTRGYNVLSCAIRGTGTSEGTWDGWFTTQEVTDNYDVIEWFAAQPWSNGKIGQEGASYGGYSTVRVAARHPPHLVAIAPQAVPDDLYLNHFYPGGIKADRSAWSIAAVPIANGSRGGQDALVTWESHPLHDGYWDTAALDDELGDVEVPMLMYGGWYDWSRSGEVNIAERVGANAWLVMGPWEHGFPFDGFAGPGDGSFAPGGAGTSGADPFSFISPGTILAWFDHWLLDMPDAPLPPARVTTMEQPIDGGRGWGTLDAFPARDARPVQLHLRTDGTVARTPGVAGKKTYDVNPLDGPSSMCFPPFGTQYPVPCDPYADRQHLDTRRLTFTSAPLDDDLVLAGRARLDLRASLSATDGNLVAKLEDVAPEGRVTEITVGYLKASHRGSHAHPASSTTSPSRSSRCTGASSPVTGSASR